MFKSTSLLALFYFSMMYIYNLGKKSKINKETPKTKRGKLCSQEEQESPNATWTLFFTW